LFHWLDRLQEAPNYKYWVKKIYNSIFESLETLSNLDQHISRDIDLWVQNTPEGYIIEFAIENHQAFFKEEVVFGEGSRRRIQEKTIAGDTIVDQNPPSRIRNVSCSFR